MLFTNKLLAHRSEKRIATYTTHDVYNVTYSIVVMYFRGQGAEIFPTAPEVDSPLEFLKIYCIATILSLGTNKS